MGKITSNSEVTRNTRKEWVEKYLKYLRAYGLFSEATLTTYKSVLENFIIDIEESVLPMQVTSEIVNNNLINKYRKHNWSNDYIKRITKILEKFFVWSKDNMYISIDIHVKNILKPECKNSELMKSAINKSDTANNLQETDAINNSPDNKPTVTESVKESVNNKTVDTSTSETVSAKTESDKINKNEIPEIKAVYPYISHSIRDTAIKNLNLYMDMTAEDIMNLNVINFMHFNMITAAKIIPVPTIVRNSLYKYLISRTVSKEPLFLSDTNERLTESEILHIIQQDE